MSKETKLAMAAFVAMQLQELESNSKRVVVNTSRFEREAKEYNARMDERILQAKLRNERERNSEVQDD